MALDDLSAVVEIERTAFPQPWSADLFRHELTANQVARYLVVCRNDIVVGYVGIWLIVGEVHLTTIAAHSDECGRGIGEWLLISAIELALDHGAQRVTLEVRETNTVARSLYQKYGFDEVGVRPGYYSETGEDALLMDSEEITSDVFQQKLRRLKQACRDRLGQRRA